MCIRDEIFKARASCWALFCHCWLICSFFCVKCITNISARGLVFWGWSEFKVRHLKMRLNKGDEIMLSELFQLPLFFKRKQPGRWHLCCYGGKKVSLLNAIQQTNVYRANVYSHNMICAQHNPPVNESSLGSWFLSETEKCFGLFFTGERKELWAGNTAANAHLIFTVTFPNEVYLCPSSLHDHQSLNTVILEYVCLGFLCWCW